MLAQPGSAFQMGQVDMHTAMVNGDSRQTDIKAEYTHTAALENTVHSASGRYEVYDKTYG